MQLTTGRIDVAAIKQAYPLAAVASARYGVEFRRAGARRLTACCPLPGHAHDRDPSFTVYAEQESFYCFGCRRGGDVIRLVQVMEGIDFREAVDRLTSGRPPLTVTVPGVAPARRPRPAAPLALTSLAAREALALAVAFYAGRLRQDEAAQCYLQRRGLSPPTLARWRLGLGGGLADYLRWLRLAPAPFCRLGLFDREGRERFADRITVPELVAGEPVWLTGRLLPGPAAAAGAKRYECLPGPRPLLGLGSLPPTVDHVLVVEGVFDLLLLAEWGEPAVALGGTGWTPAVLAALARFDRLGLVLDNDEAGRRATADLVAALGERARVVPLPPGVKDVGELAGAPAGRRQLAAALAAAGLV